MLRPWNSLRNWLAGAGASPFSIFKSCLEWSYAHLLVGSRLNDWVARTRNMERAPPRVSELYQLAWLVGGLVWLALVRQPILPVWSVWIGLALASYRVLEITAFNLHWVFLSPSVRSHQRSLFLALGDLIAIALFSAIAQILLSCEALEERVWSAFFASIGAIVHLDAGVPCNSSLGCSLIPPIRVVSGFIVLLLVIGNALGGISREPPTKDAK